MRLNPYPHEKKSSSFKGYIACPIKELHFQPDVKGSNLDIIRHVHGLGEKYGFKVVVQTAKRIYGGAERFLKFKMDMFGAAYNVWGQDNKVFLYKPNLNGNLAEVLSENGLVRNSEGNIVKYLSSAVNVNYEKMRSYLDGGNFFLGKDAEGKMFAIVGEDSISKTAKKIVAEENNINCKTKEMAIGLQGHINRIFLKKSPEYLEKAKNAVASDLGLKTKDLKIIPQPDFHIDMQVRPLEYPYVLLNDPSMVYEMVNSKLKESPPNILQEQLENLTCGIRYSRYSSVDKVHKSLESHGFKVIRVPGVVQTIDNPFLKNIADIDPPLDTLNEANFMNAVVHKTADGKLVYITNKSPKNIYGIDFNEMFRSYIEKNVPMIDKFEFVSGQELPSGKETSISHLLKFHKGGIHCMSAERPDFENWK